MPSDVANFIILRKHQKETKRKTAGTNGLDEIKDLTKAPSDEYSLAKGNVSETTPPSDEGGGTALAVTEGVKQ